MKFKIIMLIVIILLTAGRITEANGFFRDEFSSRFNPYDHMLISSTATLALNKVFLETGGKFNIKIFKDRYFRIIASSFIVFCAGYIKERYLDFSYQKTDIRANVFGICVSVCFIDVLSGNRRVK